MKVLHINQSDVSGGAAISGYRLHQGLLQQGIDSRLLVGAVKSSDDKVNSVPIPRYRQEKWIATVTERLGLNYIHITSSFDIVKHPDYIGADILSLHNLHSGFFNYLAIAKLTVSKPAIFTLHDMWSFTGHCAYSLDCDRWKIGCGSCPYPYTYPAIKRDNTKIEWQLKNWVYHNSNVNIVVPSRWLLAQVNQSMLANLPVHYIPHGIDTEAYQPLDPEKCRFILGIPPNKKVIMFSAENAKDPRKGGDLLIEILNGLPKSLKAETLLLILGDSGESLAKAVNMSAINLGYVNSDRLKSIAYSAADLFVFPTRADNLPLVLQESLACATPIVSFAIGGVPDLVRPDITGYLATPNDIEDFRAGIVRLLEDDDQRDRMKVNCREIALTEYPLDLQAKRFIDLMHIALNIRF